MSYQASISFKTIDANHLYQFFTHIKHCTRKNIDQIAEDEFIYMPSIRYKHLYKEVKPIVAEDADERWARSAVFTMRFFYLADHNLLGVFGVPSDVQECFDSTIYFQNSTDQDYDFDEWKNVPIFSQIADKWKHTSDEEIRKEYYGKIGAEEDDPEEIPLDYCRRSFAYKEIWEMIEEYLWNDEMAVHLSLFGHYDYEPIQKFVYACKQKYEEWEKR